MVAKHLPNAAKCGVFPKRPHLKEFLVSGPAIAAGVRTQHAFESRHNREACEKLIADYVLNGGDDGITEKTIRKACGLPPVWR